MSTPTMTPDELIQRIRGTKVRISPVVEVRTPEGAARIACDCSGCNNNHVYLDMFGSDDITPPETASAAATSSV